MPLHFENMGFGGSGGGGGGGSTQSGASLFDIKTMAQAVADKGWACISNQKILTKGNNPTIYNRIKEMYDNIPEVASSLTQGYSKSFSNGASYTDICKFNGYYYALNLSEIYKSTDLASTTTPTTISVGYSLSFACGENVLLLLGTNGTMYKINSDDTITALIGQTSIINNHVKLNYRVYDGYVYIFAYNESFANTGKVYKVQDSASATTLELACTFAYNIYDAVKVGQTYYLLASNGVYSTTDINDTTKYTLLWNQSFDGGNIFYHNGRFVICPMYLWGSGICYYSDDNFATTPTSTEDTIAPNGQICSCSNGGTIYAYANGTIKSIEIETMTFSSYATLNVVSMRYLDGSFMAVTDSYVYYAGQQKQSYTDTYYINGSSITQTYFLDAETQTKIVTDVSNRTTICNYLGYYPYFYLNIDTSVTLPQNNNLWTYMFVGDNYIDNDVPSGNVTRLLPQAENINVTGATPTITISANKTYSFDTAITSLTISDIETSALESVLYFTTGAGAISLSAPNTLRWGGGNEQPTLEANTVYCIAIRNGLAEIDNFGSAS